METKAGEIVPFRMNRAQRRFLERAHNRNVILKARQRGFTTFICLLMLDACLFNSGLNCGVIAHTIKDAGRIFDAKIRDVYNRLPEWLKRRRPRVEDRADQFTIAHGAGKYSSITVSMSLRSGTYQWVLVSEYGKICARMPDKADEIRTGALNTVPVNGVVCIESTAEGAEGDFFELCKRAQSLEAAGAALGALDYRFHFEPWHNDEGYVYPPEGVVIDTERRRYFEGLAAEHGIALSPEQRAWYVKTLETQREKMLREYPSTWEEAFHAAIEGAFYTHELAFLQREKRYGPTPWEPALPVHLWWDLGMDDYASCIFVQLFRREVRLIDFDEWQGRSLQSIVPEIRNTRPHYILGKWCLPHDGAVRSRQTGMTDKAFLESLKCEVLIAPRPELKRDGIFAVRGLMPRLYVDRERCASLWTHLENYKHEWDERLGRWKETPRHDEHCHAADALQTGALLIDQLEALDGFGGRGAQAAAPPRRLG